MENIEKINIPKPNSKPTSGDAEETSTSTLFKTIKAMDTPPRDIASIGFIKLMVEMNEKLEKERDALKEKNGKILKENSDLKVSEATLKEKNKTSYVKDFFNIIMGVSGATYFGVSNEVVPQYISGGVFLMSLIMYFILRKD